jgi:phage gpG-like protein
MTNDFLNKLAEIKARLPQFIKDLPRIAKVEGLQFIADNFKKQGFEKSTGNYEQWQPKKKGSKPTLIGEKRGGAMRRSWEAATLATSTQTQFTSQLPYTGVHNEGLKAGRPPGFTMPQRQMIGDSEALEGRISAKFDKMADEIFE